MFRGKKITNFALSLVVVGLVMALATGGAYAKDDSDKSVEERLAQLEEKLAMQQDGFEYHGYARSGYAVSANGGAAKQPLGHLFGSFRLGNEYGTYVEQVFSNKWTAKDGSWMKNQFLLAHSNGSDSVWNDGVALREAFVEGGNFDFAPEGTSFWAGQRFYGRDDIHITDFYWRDMSGTGAGIKGLKTDLGTMDIAFIGQSSGDVKTDLGEISQQNIDLRLKGVKALGGSIDFEVTPSWSADNKKYNGNADNKKYNGNAESGIQLAAIHNKGDFYGVMPGFTKTAIQYGNGLGASLGRSNGMGNDEDATATRVLTYGVGNLTDKTEIMPQFVYQVSDDGSSDTTTIATGARLERHHTENFAMQYEYGFDYEDKDSYDDAKTINKFTVAPTITWKSSFWSRPQLRVFGTYATASDDKSFGNGYEAGDSGMTYGFQMEVWW
ncbi:carbohydrate porin [Halanaerocella petrolearia]